MRQFLTPILTLAFASALSACHTLEGLKRDFSGKKNIPQTTASQQSINVKGATLEESSVGYGLARGYRSGEIVNNSGSVQELQKNDPALISTVTDIVPSIVQSNNDSQLVENDAIAPLTKVRTIEAYVTPLPVPQFIDIVFGEMLQVPFVTGKDVQAMSDVVQLRSSGRMKGADFQLLVTEALKDMACASCQKTAIIKSYRIRHYAHGFRNLSNHARECARVLIFVQLFNLLSYGLLTVPAFITCYNRPLRTERIKSG